MGVREEEDADVTDTFLSDPDDSCAPRQGRSLGGWCHEVVVPGLAHVAVHRLEKRLLLLPFCAVCIWAFGVYGSYVALAGIIAYYCRKSYLKYCEPISEETMPS